jgi:hypothetical protein
MCVCVCVCRERVRERRGGELWTATKRDPCGLKYESLRWIQNQRSQRLSVLCNKYIFYLVCVNTARINCTAYLNYPGLVLHTVAFAHISAGLAMPFETMLSILLAFHKFGAHSIPWTLISGTLSTVIYSPDCVISCVRVCWGVNVRKVRHSFLFSYTLLPLRNKNPIAKSVNHYAAFRHYFVSNLTLN